MQDYIRSLHSVTVRHYVPNLVCVQLPTQAFSVIAFQKLISPGHRSFWVTGCVGILTKFLMLLIWKLEVN